jgi:L-Ala-D/L-Glu epimerase
MLIERAEVIPYALPFREPYVTARGTLDRRELILFRLTSDEGIVGLGETTALSLRGGRAHAEIVAELKGAATRLVGGAQIAELGLSPEARCACSMALFDLVLRRTGRGADVDAPIACNATLAAGPPGEVAAAARRWQELGFRTFKLKVGMPGDVDAVRATRRTLGPDARIRIDANGAWDLPTAEQKLSELEPLGIELCEQPVATLETFAVLRGAGSIPLAADESVATRSDADRARASGCDLATLKLAKVGGPDEAVLQWSLPVYVSSALEGPVGIAAAGHVVQGLRAEGSDAGVAHGLATQLLFSETIATRGPEVRDGMLHLPEGPGLGVEIDEEALERHRI